MQRWLEAMGLLEEYEPPTRGNRMSFLLFLQELMRVSMYLQGLVPKLRQLLFGGTAFGPSFSFLVHFPFTFFSRGFSFFAFFEA